MDSTLKLYKLNKGISDISSRIDQILNILTKYKSHVLVLNELNLKSTDSISPYQFTDYTMSVNTIFS